MPTIWRWVIVTKNGYFTGKIFSNLIREVEKSGYFLSQDEARSYAVNKLVLTEEDFELCRVPYASLNSGF